MDAILESILSSSFVQLLLELVIKIVMVLVGILLLPISALIKLFVPDFDQGLQQLATILDWAVDYAGWILSAFAIPTLLISMVVSYYTFIITTKLSIFGFKIALNWYKTIKG